MNLVEWQDQIVDHVYAASLGESSWQDFLALLCRPQGGAKGTFLQQWVAPARGEILVSHGLHAPLLQAYGARLGSINPLMKRLHERPVGVPTTTDWACPRRDLIGTEFYADFLRPQAMQSGYGLTIRTDGAMKSVLSVFHPKVDAALTDPIPTAMRLLQPHLLRAFRIASHAAAMASLHRDVVEHLPLGVLYLTDGRRIRYANGRALRMLEEGDGLGAGPQARFFLRDREADDWITRLLHDPGSGHERRVVVARVARPDGRPWQILLIRPARTSVDIFFRGSQLILLCADPDRRSVGGARALAKAYGLSAAERRVIEGLLSGKRLAELAGQWGLSKETLRTQLASARGKVGVDHQADLIHDALRSATAFADP